MLGARGHLRKLLGYSRLAEVRLRVEANRILLWEIVLGQIRIPSSSLGDVF